MIANILSAYIKSSGGADLILCGRQASDDDQGVVPILIGEKLGLPIAPLARDVALNGSTLKVTRATPDGDEIVEGALPAVVTVSNELGTPRFPSAKSKMAARKMSPTEISIASLGVLPPTSSSPTSSSPVSLSLKSRVIASSSPAHRLKSPASYSTSCARIASS